MRTRRECDETSTRLPPSSRVHWTVTTTSSRSYPSTAHAMKTTAQRKRERTKELFARAFHSQERVEWIRSLPCALTGLIGESHNAHMRSRGAGGTYHDIVPLSFLAHRDYDELDKIRFSAKYGTTKDRVRERAADYQRLWEGSEDAD